MPRQVRVARAAAKQLDAVPKKDYLRIYDDIRRLAQDPRPDGCVKLEDDLYRIRCGAYRVIYCVLDQEGVVLVVKVARRSEKTYRDLP
ncbi:MAG: type II toxin-antitoxin system RelE/ParE family toxin [Elusimicrobia bacterium]|nr:type II toxin-antitoxin system RelE/ParE family toxin [Elusimicrobiota bacterium]